MEEFKVNDLISVKLEGVETIVYIKNRATRLCSYLFLNPPSEETAPLEEIKSIDGAIKNFDDSMKPSFPSYIPYVPPEDIYIVESYIL